MKKVNLKENMDRLNYLAKNMPKSVNEALDFYEEEAPEMAPEMPAEAEPMQDEPEMGPEMPVEDEPNIPGTNPSMVPPQARAEAAKLIDDIRKKALRAMANLADDPEDENYVMLKKVWQMTDRKPEKESDKNA